MQPLFRDSAELNRPLIPFAMGRKWGAYVSTIQTCGAIIINTHLTVLYSSYEMKETCRDIHMNIFLYILSKLFQT